MNAEQPSRRGWRNAAVSILAVVLVALLVKAFVVQAFYIPSGSMQPGLVKDDRIVVEKPSYWGSGTPQRGDVIVFADPGGWLPAADEREPGNVVTKALAAIGLYPGGGHLVKRVIGVGGDEVACCDDHGRVTVNGYPLNESAYIPAGADPSVQSFDVTVPHGSLWVMGDNRVPGGSLDSRAHIDEPGHGFLALDQVVGKVVAVVWPLGHWRFVHRPASFDDVPAPR